MKPAPYIKALAEMYPDGWWLYAERPRLRRAGGMWVCTSSAAQASQRTPWLAYCAWGRVMRGIARAPLGIEA